MFHSSFVRVDCKELAHVSQLLSFISESYPFISITTSTHAPLHNTTVSNITLYICIFLSVVYTYVHIPVITNSMAYGTRRSKAAFTRALQ